MVYGRIMPVREDVAALLTTAAGLTVAIPALIGYRYYRTRVDTLVVDMEKEAIKLVEALHRRQERAQGDKKPRQGEDA